MVLCADMIVAAESASFQLPAVAWHADDGDGSTDGLGAREALPADGRSGITARKAVELGLILEVARRPAAGARAPARATHGAGADEPAHHAEALCTRRRSYGYGVDAALGTLFDGGRATREA
jgi:enoyl-CoA hydratase/carnithine racemase